MPLTFVPYGMIRFVFIGLLFFVQESIPYKSNEDFEIKFLMSFKQRPHEDEIKILRLNETTDEQAKRTNTDPLPYLVLKVKILKVQPEEVRIRIIKDDKSTGINKKISGFMEFTLDLGFTDDIKDKVNGYKHIIEFLSADKDRLSKIVIEFDDDGNYLVNGEKRGRI